MPDIGPTYVRRIQKLHERGLVGDRPYLWVLKMVAAGRANEVRIDYDIKRDLADVLWIGRR